MIEELVMTSKDDVKPKDLLMLGDTLIQVTSDPRQEGTSFIFNGAFLHPSGKMGKEIPCRVPTGTLLILVKDRT